MSATGSDVVPSSTGEVELAPLVEVVLASDVGASIVVPAVDVGASIVVPAVDVEACVVIPAVEVVSCVVVPADDVVSASPGFSLFAPE